VRHVAQVLADIPAMPERILELAVQVAPEHLLQRLTDLGAGRHRLGEHRLGVGDVERQENRSAADRPRGMGTLLSSSASKASR
jgi:hypothetical protein